MRCASKASFAVVVVAFQIHKQATDVTNTNLLSPDEVVGLAKGVNCLSCNLIIIFLGKNFC